MRDGHTAPFREGFTLNASEIALALQSSSHGQTLEVRGGRIAGVLNLSGARFESTLRLEGCKFHAPPRLDRASFLHLDLTDSWVPGINLDGTYVADDLVLERLSCFGALHAIGLRVDGQLQLMDATVSNVARGALFLDGSEIKGGAILHGLRVYGMLSLASVRTTWATLSEAQLLNAAGVAATMDGLSVTGNLHLDGAIARGGVSLAGSAIEGNIELSRARFENPMSTALSLENTKVGGNLDFTDGRLSGGLAAEGLELGGNLRAIRLTVSSSNTSAIDLDASRVKGSIDLRRATLRGNFRANGLQLFGDLDLGDVNITDHFDGALLLDKARVLGRFNVSGAHIVGTSYLVGSEFTSGVHALRTMFDGMTGPAVVLDGTKVGSIANFERSHILGEFTACDAEFEGQLLLTSVTMRAPGRHSVCLQATSVRHQLVISPTEVERFIDLSSSTFHHSATIDQSHSVSETVLRVQVSGSNFGELTLVPGVGSIRVRARRANIGLLRVLELRKVKLDDANGWVVGGIERPRREPVQEIARLLEGRRDTRAPFVQQPWFSAAAALDAGGESEEARWLRKATVWKAIRGQRWGARALNTANGLLVGHGYYPARIMYWMIALTFAAIVTAVLAEDGFVATNPQFYTNLQVAEHYPRFNPLLYALDSTLPAALTGQSSAWRAGNEWIGLLFATFRGLGWVFAAFFVAGATGILKLRK